MRSFIISALHTSYYSDVIEDETGRTCSMNMGDEKLQVCRTGGKRSQLGRLGVYGRKTLIQILNK
jgi:hypothetical protein